MGSMSKAFGKICLSLLIATTVLASCPTATLAATFSTGDRINYIDDADENGSDEEPEVTTKKATGIGDRYATLNGQVDGNGSFSWAWFEWGTDRNDLDDKTFEKSVGSGLDNFDIHISGLDENTTYYFRAVAENDEGEDFGSIFSFRTDDDNNNNSSNDAEPGVTTRGAVNISTTSATLRGEVDANGSSTKVWFEYGTDRNDLDRETNDESVGSGSSEDFDARISGLRRDTTYYFRAVAENDEGTDFGSIFPFRTGDENSGSSNNEENNVPPPSAVTTPATFILVNSAQLNSLIFTSTNDPTNIWFEWGTNINLGKETAKTRIATNLASKHASALSGLIPGTTYYFRAVAENDTWRNNGPILSFVTNKVSAVTPPRPPVITPPIIITKDNTATEGETNKESSVMLAIDGGAETITNGEQREYHVAWKNESGQTLEKVVLRVLLPLSMNFVSSNKGSFSETENTLSYDIGTLSKDETGELSLTANVGNEIKGGEIIVVVISIIYTDKSDVQRDVLAYAKHTAHLTESALLLGANVLGAGFLPNTLFGWLLLITLLLILLVLGKRLVRSAPKTEPIQY